MATATPVESSAEPPAGRASTRRRRRPVVIWAVPAVIVAGVVAAWALSWAFRPHLYAGTVFQESTSAPPMDGLTLVNGDPVDLAGREGKVVLVYFGYTNCPDVCPATLSAVVRATEEMGQRGSEVDLLMVSVDPARDDPEGLEDYLDFFDPRFAGVSGGEDDIATVASQYGVFYQLGDGTPETGYTVDHTASLMGIGPDGSLRVVWSSGVTADALQADLEELLG